MKHYFILLFALCCGLSLNAQINYTNYGDGWVIPMNANQELDINDDGIVDLYVNQHPDELGLTAVFVVGCISSTGDNNYVSFGARELATFEYGDEIQGSQANTFDYIDEGRGSGYHKTQGYADGFEANKDYYLGFMLIIGSQISNGWMKVELNDEAEVMIIKEVAYGAFVSLDDPGILAGDTGQSLSINDLGNELSEISIAPNPAQDFFKIDFDYTSSTSLTVDVYNAIGQLVDNVTVADEASTYNLTVNTTDWTSGVYYVRFQSNQGARTERVSVR